MDVQAFAYELARRYAEENATDLGAATTKTILGWVRSRSFKRLVTATTLFDPEYHGSNGFKVLLQICSFFKKNADFAVTSSCEDAAHKSFERAEKICRITNRRLDYYSCHPSRLPPELAQMVNEVPNVVERILGPFRPFLDTLPSLVRLTSGASSSLKKAEAAPVKKLRAPVEVTSGAVPYIRALQKYWGYEVRTVETACNRITLVPKNWKTHRTIACEPTGNMPLQLAFDVYCKRRLKPYGVDLTSQFKNQEYARVGSITGHYTTLDLEMASDTVAYNTAAWCLPVDWFRYLNAIRSREFRKDHRNLVQRGVYAKFSSMGNGSTFGIETLVFTACCIAAGSRDFCVYGDDIVVEPDVVPRLLAVLRYFGFLVNSEKSHFTGPVRESCGSYWFSGQDVNPFYLRSAKGNMNLCLLVNSLVERCVPEGPVWELLSGVVSSEKLPIGPFDGDPCGNVWITCHGAYQKHILRNDKKKPWTTFYKKYQSVEDEYTCRNEKALFLWYLAASRRNYKVSSRAGRMGSNNLLMWVDNNGEEMLSTQKLLVDVDSVREADKAINSLIKSSGWSASEGAYARKRVQWHPIATCSSLTFAWERYLDARNGHPG